MARHRRPPPMSSESRHGERYYALNYEADPSLRLYVYIWNRLEDRRVTPAVYRGPLCDADVMKFLRETYNGGTFNFMVRRGEQLQLSELVALAPHRDRMHVFEAHRAKYGW